MKEQDILNEMLEKNIKKLNEPMWKKNVKATILLTTYFILLPGSIIYTLIKGYWYISILLIIPTILGIGVALGGRKFTMWLMMQLMKLKMKMKK